MIVRFLGVDTAQVNCGFSVLEYDGSDVRIAQRGTMAPNDKRSDITINDTVMRGLSPLIESAAVVAAESAAMSAKFGMVSTGSIHGALLATITSRNAQLIYATPNKVKYFARGPFRRERDAPGTTRTCWDKKDIQVAVCEAFGISYSIKAIGRAITDDEADATVLACMAMWAWFACRGDIGNTPSEDDGVTPWDASWAREVFLSRKVDDKKSGKMAGILHRPGEFYWKRGI
jgi:Holliday junction resolvasome RuvABC endonuclease subunit